ncbi:MAG TPA: hypothetical protein VGT40_26810 [Methylomirabilota bacterium]|jgi:hypothetical protein|nr:hypothetical protein [Methylomirabilota bacterium]
MQTPGLLRVRAATRWTALALLLALGSGIAAATSAPRTLSPGAPASSPAEAEATIEAVTPELLRLVERARRAPADGAVITLLDQLLVERRQALEYLLETSPEAALRHATLARERQRFPPAVRANLEERVQIEGTVEVFHEDGFGGSRYVYRLRDRGASWKLYLTGPPPGWLTGQRVRIRGLRIGGAVVADDTGAESRGVVP